MYDLEMVGIVAEWHPFHLGHLALIRHIQKERPDAVICAIMSGPFTQRGEAAFFDKWTRTEMALAGGVDLVLELPQGFATSSLAYFASGAVRSLLASGCLSALAFGSETADLLALRRMAAALRTPSPVYQKTLKEGLAQGQPYMIAHQQALTEATGVADLEQRPNDRLAVHYLAALPTDFPVLTLQRNSDHNGAASGRAIRAHLADGLEATDLLPAASLNIIRRAYADGWRLPQEERLYPSLRMALLGRDPTADFAHLDPAQTGARERFQAAAKKAETFEAFVATVKSRHYHEGRVRRDVLALLSPIAEKSAPGYLRVLGADQKGRALLKIMHKKATVPCLVNPGKDRRLLSAAAAKQFAADVRRQNLAAFLQDNAPYTHMDRDYRVPPLMR